MDTLQTALKALYYSLGGNADNVRDMDEITAIIDACSALGLGKAIAEGGGGGDGALVVHLNRSTLALDKTFKEIAEASSTVPVVIVTAASGIAMQQPLLMTMGGDGQYVVAALGVNVETGELAVCGYVTKSEDDYPVLQQQS